MLFYKASLTRPDSPGMHLHLFVFLNQNLSLSCLLVVITSLFGFLLVCANRVSISCFVVATIGGCFFLLPFLENEKSL
jgi:hypothetical protein